MDKKYILDTVENKEFLRKLREELLLFGGNFASPGGSSYYLGDDGTPWPDRPRETWITSRMVHVYSMGVLLAHEGSKELADAGLKGLMDELKDKDKGGWYAGITATGEILPNKQCYAHAFVILAATSALLAKREGAGALLEEALRLYDERFWNEEEGLAADIWDTDFTKLDDYRGLNANMHSVEAFLAVADATGDDVYRQRAGRIIEKVIGWAENNNWRIPEHFDSGWVADLECNKDRPDDPFKPYGATPGHGIEWARLIVQWATSTFSKDEVKLTEYVKAAEELYNRAITDAWNADGEPGIVYTTDWDGNPVVHDRMHWTLAEAINTSAVLYRVTGLNNYLDEKVHDKKNGSWFHQMDASNRVIGTVWPGKSDIYHAIQSTLIPYLPVSVSVASNIKREAIKL